MTEFWYRPDGSGPISVGQFLAEGHKFGAEGTVARWEDDEVAISTVFLGLDYSWGRAPLIYESMVFGGTFDRSVRRYPTRDAALAGHEELVAIVLLDQRYEAKEAPTS